MAVSYSRTVTEHRTPCVGYSTVISLTFYGCTDWCKKISHEVFVITPSNVDRFLCATA